MSHYWVYFSNIFNKRPHQVLKYLNIYSLLPQSHSLSHRKYLKIIIIEIITTLPNEEGYLWMKMKKEFQP